MFSILRDNAVSSSSSTQNQCDKLVHNLSKAYEASINPQLLWQQRLRKMLAYTKRLLEQEKKKRYIKERIELTMEANTQSGLCLGDQRLRKIRWQLNNFGVVRSADQVLFHEAFLIACLPKIYGKDWAEHSIRVLSEMQLEKIDYEILCMTPRRWGKTWSVALFVLALLIHCPGIEICIFSTGKRASGSLLQIIIDFLMRTEGGANMILVQNQENLYINPLGTSKSSGRSSFTKVASEAANISKLHSFPSSTAGTFIHTHTTKDEFHMDLIPGRYRWRRRI